MKKTIISIVAAFAAITISAQTVNVHFKNGQTIEFPSSNVDFVDFSEKPSGPTLTAGQVVDLGLSVYWASCNLGAEKPEDYGDLFSWGETKSKTSFFQSTYSLFDYQSTNCIDIGDNICGTEYDAARALLGEDWRLPSKNELEELLNNCTWEWTQINNINGYRVQGNNGNSIFIPAAGYNPLGVHISIGQWLGYWSGNSSGENRAKVMMKLGGNPVFSTIERWCGLSIRPVTSNPNAGGDAIDHSQDYLVTDKVTASFTGGSIHSINGVIQSGSVLNVKFTNGSNEPVTLVGIQINDAANGNQGNNALDAEIEVAAGESKSYSITLGTNVRTPVVCFTYRYNSKNYKAEATWGQ